MRVRDKLLALLDRLADSVGIRRDDGTDIPAPTGDKEPLRLDQLPHAATPPRMDPDWEQRCWTVFGLGVVTVLVALATIAGPAWLRTVLRWVLLAELLLVFLLAAVNTYRAARWYGERQRELEAWFASRIAVLSTVDRSAHQHFETQLQDGTPQGALSLFPSGMLPHEWSRAEQFGVQLVDPSTPGTTWRVEAIGHFIPEPYRAPGPNLRVTLDYREFIDLLRAETRAVRTRAATLAGALGGLFVAGLQTLARL